MDRHAAWMASSPPITGRFLRSTAMKDTAQAASAGEMENWRDETTVLHGDSGLTADSSVVPPIHYSATFRADDAAQFADMANTPRHPGFYTRYGNPVHK